MIYNPLFQRGRMTFSRYELAPHPYFELHIRKYEIGHEICLTGYEIGHEIDLTCLYDRSDFREIK